MKFIKKHFLKKQFFLFLITGGINAVNGILASVLYSTFLQANIAFILGYITALIIAFILNSFFVFKAKPNLIKLAKFAISYIPNFIIQNGVILIFYNVLQWHILFAYLLAFTIGIPITFLMLKLFAFKKK
jgi:putative flippase GtrA